MLFNFGWVRDGEVAGMGFPAPEVWPLLAAEGIGAVLSLTERTPPGDPQAAGLAACHIPIRDFGVPSDADLRRCVTFVREQVEAGRPVVVHCHAGIGRTGTILAVWLVERGLSSDDAIRTVRTLRPGSIENAAQERVVHRYGRRVAQRGEAPDSVERDEA